MSEKSFVKTETQLKKEEEEKSEADELTKNALEILTKLPVKRTEADIAVMIRYIRQFDFIKKEQAQKQKRIQEEKEKMYQTHRVTNEDRQSALAKHEQAQDDLVDQVDGDEGPQ